MRGSFRIARPFGIDLKVHWSFLLVFGFILLISFAANRDVSSLASYVVLVTGLFACVVLHELGHALAARRFGIPTRDITLLPIGGVARLERMTSSPFEELVVALAGPAVNIVIAFGLAAVLLVTVGIGGILNPPNGIASLAVNLLLVNVAMVVFNLLPAFPMDGGRVLRASLSAFMDFATATRIAAFVGQTMAIGFALIGLFVLKNPMLLGVAAFVFFAAKREGDAAKVWSRIRDLQVRHAVETDFVAMSPWESVGLAARKLVLFKQRIMPLSHDGNYFGALTTECIADAYNRGQKDTPVAELCGKPVPVLTPGDSLMEAGDQLRTHGFHALPVVQGRWLVGIVTADSLAKAFRAVAADTSEVSANDTSVLQAPTGTSLHAQSQHDSR